MRLFLDDVALLRLSLVDYFLYPPCVTRNVVGLLCMRRAVLPHRGRI